MAESRHRAKNESLLDRTRRLAGAAIRIGNAALHGALDWLSPPLDLDERGVPRRESYSNAWLPPHATRSSFSAHSANGESVNGGVKGMFDTPEVRAHRRRIGGRIVALTATALDARQPRQHPSLRGRRVGIRYPEAPTRVVLEDFVPGSLSGDPCLRRYDRAPDGTALRTSHYSIIGDGVRVVVERGVIQDFKDDGYTVDVNFTPVERVSEAWADETHLLAVEWLLAPVLGAPRTAAAGAGVVG